jgi:hypothetical protein
MRTWTREQVEHFLRTNDEWVRRGVLALYARQTEGEQLGRRTLVHNHQGFNQYDARWFSAVAEALLKYPARRLTPEGAERLRPRLMKYVGQLTRVANEREAQS